MNACRTRPVFRRAPGWRWSVAACKGVGSAQRELKGSRQVMIMFPCVLDDRRYFADP